MKVDELFEETYKDVSIKEKDVKNGKIIHDYTNDIINGNFNCYSVGLTSLEYCPLEVNGDFSCSNNDLTSLEYGPLEINSFFNCANNILTSLEYCPNKTNNFYCFNNRISSLTGIGKDYCFEINGTLDLEYNPLTSNVLGLLKIKGLKEVLMNNEEVEKIMNKHLVDRDIVKCKQELIEAGFKEFAKL